MRMRPTARVLVACLLLQGCYGSTPPNTPVVRLQPTTTNLVWIAGRPVVWQDLDGVRVATRFEEQDSSSLALRVEVQNDSPARVEIDPHEMTFNDCFGEKVESCTQAQRVVDPEQALANVDRQHLKEGRAETEQAIAAGAFLILLTGIAVADASRRPVERTGEDRVFVQGNGPVERPDLKDKWANVALRRNTIEPGEAVGGNVYVPVDRRSHYVWLHVPAGKRLFSFCFRQQTAKGNWREEPAIARCGEPG